MHSLTQITNCTASPDFMLNSAEGSFRSRWTDVAVVQSGTELQEPGSLHINRSRGTTSIYPGRPKCQHALIYRHCGCTPCDSARPSVTLRQPNIVQELQPKKDSIMRISSMSGSKRGEGNMVRYIYIYFYLFINV